MDHGTLTVRRALKVEVQSGRGGDVAARRWGGGRRGATAAVAFPIWARSRRR